MTGANICPLAEIGLAQNHRSGGAQFFRDERIFEWLGTDQRERSGRRHHPVGSINVVFDQNGNSV